MADNVPVWPFVLEADEGPLDVEDVVADHVGLAVFHQELEVVHGFLHVLLMQDVADQAQVDIGWRAEERRQMNVNARFHSLRCCGIIYEMCWEKKKHPFIHVSLPI